MILLAEDLSLVAMTPEAEHLLTLIDHDGTDRLPLPTPVLAVAAAIRAPVVPASTRVRARTGIWLNLHASRLNRPPGTDQLAVVIEPVEPRATVPLLLSAHGLSPREAEVATLVLRGNPTRAIADELHISSHTVQDHLKAVFDKIGVRSRRDLVSRLLSPPP